ncbi:MAG TPA: multicopper oxidase domain-containing protein [Kineosporiaceae bacterium]|nr:multicopper oxidase domain-containing protein [Kineosporiaceae bacterium]
MSSSTSASASTGTTPAESRAPAQDRTDPSAPIVDPAPGGVRPPDNPQHPGRPLEPFRAVLTSPVMHHLSPDVVHTVDIAATVTRIHPDLPPVPAWGYGVSGRVTSPGPWLEARSDVPVIIRWRNRLPSSVRPQDLTAPVPELPFVTSVVEDPDADDSRQNHLGREGGSAEPTAGVPIGWTSTHLHGGHTRPDADGWPDNLTATSREQLCGYDNTFDNADLGLDKVGAFLWYHDHAMNGTRHHVFSGLAGGYLLRDRREDLLGLPTMASDGEIPLLLADRNLDATGGRVRLLHKTTTDTAEFFGPLTLVNGRLWPRLPLRSQVYRLRLLNGSNARTYRLHLITVQSLDIEGRHGDGEQQHGIEVIPLHERVLIIGTDGGLLWRAHRLADGEALTLAPAERIDALVNLTGLPDGARLYLVNSAQAPFGGDPAPSLPDLWRDGDRPGRNPFPWVLRLDVDRHAPYAGQPAPLFHETAEAELNPGFRRLVHSPATSAPATGSPRELTISEDHGHRIIALAETNPPGHLYLQELVEDPGGAVELQLSHTDPGPKRYRVENWMAGDPARSDRHVSFYDRTTIRPVVGRWEVWRLVNTTGDTHPIHIHQSMFQPLGDAGIRLLFQTPDPADPSSTVNRYDPLTRATSAPLLPDPDTAARPYEPHEVYGWKDVIRVDPGNVVSVAIRFDLPGRYVYHCHILEHEDTEMMRPFVVTVTSMEDGADSMHM